MRKSTTTTAKRVAIQKKARKPVEKIQTEIEGADWTAAKCSHCKYSFVEMDDEALDCPKCKSEFTSDW